jgi:hypothetical protein
MHSQTHVKVLIVKINLYLETIVLKLNYKQENINHHLSNIYIQHYKLIQKVLNLYVINILDQINNVKSLLTIIVLKIYLSKNIKILVIDSQATLSKLPYWVEEDSV